MKCAACGFESGRFIIQGQEVKPNAWLEIEYISSVGFDLLYACPKCGTVRIDKEEIVRKQTPHTLTDEWETRHRSSDGSMRVSDKIMQEIEKERRTEP
jgi:hypothetical protein